MYLRNTHRSNFSIFNEERILRLGWRTKTLSEDALSYCQRTKAVGRSRFDWFCPLSVFLWHFQSAHRSGQNWGCSRTYLRHCFEGTHSPCAIGMLVTGLKWRWWLVETKVDWSEDIQVSKLYMRLCLLQLVYQDTRDPASAVDSWSEAVRSLHESRWTMQWYCKWLGEKFDLPVLWLYSQCYVIATRKRGNNGPTFFVWKQNWDNNCRINSVIY